jgi:type I restriction enzyme S subunit
MYNSYYEKILTTGEVKCIDEEIPFEIPESWEWVRLNELGIYRKGPFGSSLTKFMFVPKSATTIKVYEQKNAIQKDYTLGEYYITQEKFQSMLSFIVKPLDIIVSCAGTIGESYVLPEDAPIGIINQALMRISLFKMDICDYYLLYFDYILKRQAQLLSSGSAIKNIPPFEILKNMLMPIPPLAEQKRILGRTDEIINAISKYELLKETLDKLDTDLQPQLKKSILQYAIQGKLVEQCDTDEPATDLLKRIHEEKLNLVKQGKLKKKDVSESTIFRSDDNRYYEKVGSIVNDITDEIPYELPETWSFVRLSSICCLDDGIKHSGEKLPYMDAKFHRGKGDITYLTQGKIVEPPCKVILVDGENSGEIFNITERGYLGSTFKILRIANCISEEWLHLLLDAYRDVFKNSKVGAAIPHLNKNLFRNLIIGLPPYEEQIRITEKVLALQKSIEGV